MKVSIEKQSDGSFIAYNTTGDKVQLIGTGSSVREAKEDFYNAIEPGDVTILEKFSD